MRIAKYILIFLVVLLVFYCSCWYYIISNIKNDINGFLIDENSGIIKVINLLPDSYVVKVFYCFNDIEVSTEIKIIVNPILIYNNNNLLIKYKTDITTLVPTFNPGGGKFFTDSKILSNNIYLDETNGKIVIDEANIGNYDINIKYSYNNQIVNSNLVFSIIPVVLYDFCDYTFYNGIDNFIEKPYLNPYGGKFSLKTIRAHEKSKRHQNDLLSQQLAG